MSVQPMFTEQTRAAEAVVRVLEQAGIEFVFGVSGGHTGAIFEALGHHQSTIRAVLVRQESLAGVMAEVYGRLTGKPGVTMGQAPWVLGYGLVGILEALLSSTPMLVLTEYSDQPHYSLHGPYQTGVGNYGAWDAWQSFKGVSKQVVEARESSELVHGVQLALKHATVGQPGPVTLLFTAAAVRGSVGPDSKPALYPTSLYLPELKASAEQAQVNAAVSALMKAERPVLVAGNGVRISNAFAALKEFVEAAQLPVVTSANGKGMIEETHPMALGVFGSFGAPAANACLGEADVVLVVGSKLGASDTAGAHPNLIDPRRQTIIQIDIEPRNVAWTFPVERVLVGDACRVLGQIRAALQGPLANATGHSRVESYRKSYGHFDAPKYWTDEEHIIPQRIIGEMMRSLPDDVIVTTDAGENRIFMTNLYQTRRAGHYIMAGGAGPMGYAIPAALAAKLVHPEKPVVAVCGDGGFAMTMNGLLTAVTEDIPIIVVIFNNASLGWARHLRGEFFTDLGQFDYAAIARGMGCEGIRVTDSRRLADVLRTAVKSARPFVVDVVTSLSQSFAEVQSPLVASSGAFQPVKHSAGPKT